MRNILASMIVAIVISMALIGMAGADPFIYVGKDTTKMVYDLQVLGGKDISALTGASIFDFSAATGAFKTSTGTNTFGGNGVFAAGKNLTLSSGGDITMSGSGAVLTGIDAVFNNVTVNGILGVGTNVSNGIFDEDIALATGKDWYSIAGAGVVDFGNMTGYFKSSSGINYLNGNVLLAANKNLTASSGTGKVDFSGMSGTMDTPTGTFTINSNAIQAGLTTFTTGSGLFTSSGNAKFNQNVAYSTNASTIVATVLTSSSTKTVYGVDAHSANVTITLPDAATVTGRSYQIGTDVDPGSNYVKITATTSDKLGGSGGFTIAQTTDAKAGMTVVSDGTLYLISGAYGTWAEGTS